MPRRPSPPSTVYCLLSKLIVPSLAQDIVLSIQDHSDFNLDTRAALLCEQPSQYPYDLMPISLQPVTAENATLH